VPRVQVVRNRDEDNPHARLSPAVPAVERVPEGPRVVRSQPVEKEPR
jgi:hypothetical protein